LPEKESPILGNSPSDSPSALKVKFKLDMSKNLVRSGGDSNKILLASWGGVVILWGESHVELSC
jgi:hypothetical protein